jgi:hypothetical protein
MKRQKSWHIHEGPLSPRRITKALPNTENIRKMRQGSTLGMDTSLAIAIAKAGITKSKASVKSRKSLPSEYEGQAFA